MNSETITIISNFKFWVEIIGAVCLMIATIILLVKMLTKKIDKNKDGKIDKEEITNEDIEFCKELLKDSLKVIATGLAKQAGLSAKQAYNLTLEEVKKSKTIFEKEIEEEGEKKESVQKKLQKKKNSKRLWPKKKKI